MVERQQLLRLCMQETLPTRRQVTALTGLGLGIKLCPQPTYFVMMPSCVSRWGYFTIEKERKMERNFVAFPHVDLHEQVYSGTLKFATESYGTVKQAMEDLSVSNIFQ